MGNQDHYHRSKVWALAIHIALSSYIYCFGLSSISPCIDNIGTTLGWEGSYLLISFFTTIFPIGTIIGAILGPYFSSSYGGRITIIAFNFLYILGSLITIIPSNITFGIGRLITGIVGGVFITVPAVLINEITPDEMTGQVGILVGIACNCAFLTSYLLGLILPIENLENDPTNSLWMLVMFCPAFFSCYQIVYFFKVFKSEFPAWLIKNHREDEARESLMHVYTEAGVEDGIKRLLHAKENDNNDDSIKQPLIAVVSPSYKEIFTSKKYRKMLRIAILLSVAQQISGITPILIYSNSIFISLGGGVFMAKIYSVILGLVLVISGFIAIPLLSKLGRKTLLVYGQLLIVIDLLALSIFTGPVNYGDFFNAMLIYLFFVVFVPSFGSAYWSFVGEVLIDKCIGLALATNLAIVISMSFLFPVLNNFLVCRCAF